MRKSVKEIRDTRTVSPFKQFRISPVEAAELLRTKASPGYQHILDIMEVIVAEEDTALINSSKDDEVLAQHKIAKAAWNFFVKVQQRIDAEIKKGLHEGEEVKAALVPPKRDTDLY